MLRPALAAAAAAIIIASPAAADTYTVLSCGTPTAASAANGWSALPAATGEGQALDACTAGGTLSALLNGPRPAGGASASWTFSAPPATRIVSFGATRRTTGVTPASAQAKDVSYVLDTDQVALEVCDVASTSPCTADLAGPVDKQGLDAGFVRARVLCTNAGDSCSRSLRADLSGIRVGLQDTSAPVVSDVKVLDSGERSGVLTIGFNASDTGGGVYRAIIRVDGKPAATEMLGDAGCIDADPTNADAYEFLLPVPCPAAVSAHVTKLDYRSLAEGPHGVEIDIEDAAGNSTAAFGPVQFPRLNGGDTVTGSSGGTDGGTTGSGDSTGTVNGGTSKATVQRLLHARLKMWFVGSHTHRFTSRFGVRTVTRGWLRDRKGRGLEGVRIDVFHIIHGTRRLLKTGLKTRDHGRLTLILPNNVDTRKIEFDFRPLWPGKVTSRQVLYLTVMFGGRVYHQPW